MRDELQDLINKYRRLPSFIQGIAIKKIIAHLVNEVKNSQETDEEKSSEELKVYMKELFKSSKPQIRIKEIFQFSFNGEDSIIEALSINEQYDLIEKIDYEDAIKFWPHIKDEDIKKYMVTRFLEHMKKTAEPNMAIESFSRVLSRTREDDVLKLFANEIYEIFKNYDFDEIQKEESQKYGYSYEARRREVVTRAIFPIWDVLTPIQIEEIIPILIDEFLNRTIDYHYPFNKILSDIPSNIQLMYFDKIFSKEMIPNAHDTSNFNELWGAISPEIQMLKFDAIQDFVKNQTQKKSMLDIWKYTSPEVQEEKIHLVLNVNEMYLREFWELYECTEGNVQIKFLENLIEQQEYDTFKNIFSRNLLKSDEKIPELISKYMQSQGLDEEKIGKIIDLYSRLHEKNNEINKTIDFDFLCSDIIEKMSDEQLLRITLYPEAQKSLIKYKDNKAFMSMFSELLNTDENWTIVADKIFTNLSAQDKYKFETLLTNISDKDLTEGEARNLIEILSTQNYFGLSTCEDVRDFQSHDGKKNKIIEQIFNGDYTNLPPQIREAFYNPERLKRFAVSEYLLNISPIEIGHIVQNYSDGIKVMGQLENNPEFNENLEYIKRYLGICEFIQNANEQELDGLISYVSNPENQIYRYNIMDMESRIINLFGKSIENDLYKVEEHAGDFVFTDTYDDKGSIKTVSVHRMQDDFNALVRIEGAYVRFTPPEDFKKYFEVPSIENHGNCESIISNALIAPAREKNNSVAVGYSVVPNNALLLMGPIDLVSCDANKTLAPANHQHNCTFYGVEEEVNKTRHTHNEVVKERVLISPDGNVEKLKPSYIIWFEEELAEKCPPAEGDSKSEKWQIAKQAAAQMDLPIVVINREYYAQRETGKMQEMEAIIQGTEPLPEGKTLPDVMESLVLVMENNANSLRFSDKIKGKYFTREDRERINAVISDKLEELSETNPGLAYECLQRIIPRCEYERDSSEIEEISDFYRERSFEMNQLRESLNMGTGIETQISEEQKQGFDASIVEIAGTPYYAGQKQHSIEHIEKVMLFSQVLAQNEGLSAEDTKVLLAAAAFHDSSRNGNEHQVEHAEEGAKTAGEYFSDENNPFGVKKEDVPIIQVAIEYHEFNENPRGILNIEKLRELCDKHGVAEEDFGRAVKTSELLKDADALDRTRFAERGGLDTRYLRSDTAKSNSMVFFAQKVNDEYAKQVISRNYDVAPTQGKNVAILREQRIANPDMQEKQLSTEEMVDLFTELAKGRGSVQPSLTERIEALFRGYAETEMTIKDIEEAGQTLESDVAKHDRIVSRTNSKKPSVDIDV